MDRRRTFAPRKLGHPDDMADFRVERYAAFGIGEPWVARVMLGLSAIVDATAFAQRDEIKLAIASAYEGLVEAFNDLREIRRISTTLDISATERQGKYSAFYVHLWRAYKDRFGNNVPRALGYDLGFLWQTEDKFESAAARFVDAHPQLADLIEMLRDDRCSWQQKLAIFRNEHLEHKRALKPEFVASFYTLAGAELAFENVWEAIEDISVQLLIPHLAPGAFLVEIPEAERDPAMPQRFRFAVSDPPTE
jgi:hypothetical protein